MVSEKLKPRKKAINQLARIPQLNRDNLPTKES